MGEICPYCLTNEAINRCSACKEQSYCSKECQKKHWVVHRVDCLRRRNEPVSEDFIKKAENGRDILQMVHSAIKNNFR